MVYSPFPLQRRTQFYLYSKKNKKYQPNIYYYKIHSIKFKAPFISYHIFTVHLFLQAHLYLQSSRIPNCSGKKIFTSFSPWKHLTNHVFQYLILKKQSPYLYIRLTQKKMFANANAHLLMHEEFTSSFSSLFSSTMRIYLCYKILMIAKTSCMTPSWNFLLL